MLRCLTKSKVDCSFQNNEFRFKNGGFTQFFFGFLFFFSFLRSTLDEINTKRYVKNYGFFFLERRGKKEEKTQFLWKKEKNLKKKGPDGIRTRDLRLPWQPSRCLTRPTPYHLATEPLTHTGGKIKCLKPSTQNAH